MAVNSLVNGAPIDDATGKVATDRLAGTVDTVQDGFPYTAAGLLVLDVSGLAADTYFNGFGFRGGKLLSLVQEVDTLVYSYNRGFLLDPINGALLFSLTLPIAGYINGWPVCSFGVICAV